MKFHFTADYQFEAENIDNAFQLIAGHFLELAGEIYPTDHLEIYPKSLEGVGTIEIKKEDENDTE